MLKYILVSWKSFEVENVGTNNNFDRNCPFDSNVFKIFLSKLFFIIFVSKVDKSNIFEIVIKFWPLSDLFSSLR